MMDHSNFSYLIILLRGVKNIAFLHMKDEDEVEISKIASSKMSALDYTATTAITFEGMRLPPH